jgi:hypothetical protein
MAGEDRVVELVWLPGGRQAKGADFADGEKWPTFDAAVLHAGEAKRPDGKRPWIRCDGKFILSPEDIAAAYPDVKGTR